MTKIIHEEFDYCGVCPDFKGICYYEKEEDFQKNKTENMKEYIFCDFFIIPIRLTKEEYENIPKWCPLEDKP